MRRLFVINPAARGVSDAQVRALRESFLARTGAFDEWVTRGWLDARDRVRAALSDGVEQIIAVGGDGTVGAVANGFFDGEQRALSPGATLVVTEFGTGADYRRSLRALGDLGPARDWRESAIAGSAGRPVDLGLVRFDSSRLEPRFFVNALTAGITAQIVEAKHRLSSRVPGALRYFLPTLSALAYRGTHRVRYESLPDPIASSGELLALFVAKGSFIGGGMRLTPGAPALSDGGLRVIAVPNMTAHRVVRNLARLYGAGLIEADAITRASVRAIRVRGEPPLPIEIDGEPMMMRADFSVEVRAGAIRVLG